MDVLCGSRCAQVAQDDVESHPELIANVPLGKYKEKLKGLTC
jgi:hypothetical protein